MEDFHGIKVTVSTLPEHGGLLPIYDEPDLTELAPYKTQHYIEAKTNAIFQVDFSVTKNFQWRGTTVLRYGLRLDGEHCIAKTIKKANWLANKAAYKKEDGFGKTFSKVYSYCSDSRQWKHGDMSFGALQTGKP